MQEQSMKKNDDNVGIECVVKSNNGYGRLSLGKIGDKFNINDVVYVLTESEYQSLMQLQYNDSVTAEPEPEPKREIDKELEKLLKVSLEPINETHKKQLEYKDNQLNAMNDKLNAMEHRCNQLKDKINQLSLWDMIRHKKHYDIINDFTNSIWIINKDNNKIKSADVPALTSDDQQEQD